VVYVNYIINIEKQDYVFELKQLIGDGVALELRVWSYLNDISLLYKFLRQKRKQITNVCNKQI
jgi:hypothetical protein